MFGKANRNEASKLKEVLTRYSVLSGQRVNEEKSALFFSKNTPDGVSQAVADILGVPREVKLGKYLGLPAEWGTQNQKLFISFSTGQSVKQEIGKVCSYLKEERKSWPNRSYRQSLFMSFLASCFRIHF
ncbi:hypothetical protein LINPERHAP1_LOCUS10567 [Linum perenne]